jgi:hypothetical protein
MSYVKEKVAVPVYRAEIDGRGDPLRWPRDTLLTVKVGGNFTDHQRPLGLKATEFFLVDAIICRVALEHWLHKVKGWQS